MRLQEGYSSLIDLARALDEASDPDRLNWMATQGRAEQRNLWRIAAEADPIALEDFVPAAFGTLVPARHRGRNTLPLPPPHRGFEKRFCRPSDGSDRLFGYNEAPSRRWIGPGYFVARPDERGVVIDYREVPDAEVPPGWPAVVPNTQGLQWFVYRGTRDVMRRVSRHVSIGAAFRGARPLDHYFLLCREP